ncbi:MAG TPA: hypothetical protein DHV01_14560 [Rhodoferax sp.]|uniref:S1 family peptidase n=1 Tax=Rhodoferax sp. TaxID=50421 RepID=UPI000ECD8D23|nr:serine protease [Rhodoferax sp.]HCX82804.1 hypothetical protein [Rhodoferax sp.]
MKIAMPRPSSIVFAIACALTTILPSTSFAQDMLSASLNTVRITDPKKGWGHGVRIDANHILTAAHVVDESAEGTQFTLLDTSARDAGLAMVEKIGHRKLVDLALLRITKDDFNTEVSAPLKVCKDNVKPGTPLFVFYENRGQHTHASADQPQWHLGVESATMTEAFFSHGVSGAAVFDVEKNCLAGIVSQQRLTNSDTAEQCLTDTVNKKPLLKACSLLIGTVFVPALDIGTFLGQEQF